MFSKKNLLGKPVGFFGPTPGIADVFIVVILCLAAFIFYDQWYDMNATAQQSSDLLDLIFKGKPFTFYTFVLDKATAGGYMPPAYDPADSPSAAYNIVLYLVLAVWELPVYVMNHIVPLSNYVVVLELWARFLSILLIVICYFQMIKLSEILMTDKTKAKWAGYYFISSPLIVYCIIIRNQLDIVPVLLIILALKQYFKKKYIPFCLIMSVACCFKLMPIFIVIPLLCLAEKRIGKLFQYILLSISLYAVTTFVPMFADSGYGITQSGVVNSEAFSDYIFKVIIPGGVSNTSVFLLIFFLLCVVAYVVKPQDKDYPIFALMLGFAAMSNFFLFVKWHPQWMILLLPFITLIVFSLIDFEFGIILDIVLTLGFLVTSIIVHLTAMVFTSSIFYTITCSNYAPLDNFNPIYFYVKEHGYTTIIPSTLLFAGIAALLLVAFLNNRSRQPDISSPFDNKYTVARGWFYTRSALILIYILPTVISYLSHPIS